MFRLSRVLTAIRGRSRAPTPAETSVKADRSRREGRLQEAARLIASGLERNPNHASGHLEEGDLDASRRHLERALRLYPDFLEAQALLDVVADRSTGVVGTPAGEPALPTLRLETLAGTRDVVLARTDGAVVFGQLAKGGPEPLGALLGRTVRMASATLARAGLGVLRRGVIDVSSGLLVVRSEAGLILSLACPETTKPGIALLEINRLWTAALPESTRTP